MYAVSKLGTLLGLDFMLTLVEIAIFVMMC